MDTGKYGERATRRAGIICLLSCFCVVAGGPASQAAEPAATAAAPGNGVDLLDEVIVTGTSIKRINAETALPVQILKQ